MPPRSRPLGSLSRVKPLTTLDSQTVWIPLQAWRISPRKPRLEAGPDGLALRVPIYFGRRRWSLPMAGTVVSRIGVSPTPAPADTPPAEDQMFKVAQYIPFLTTTNDLVQPNIVLLFAEPAKVPRTRWITAIGDFRWGPFETRRQTGPSVDGLLLRAAQPDLAVSLLAGHGIEQVSDPNAWLRAHREMVTNPTQVAQTRRLITSARRWNAWFQGSFVVLAIAGSWLRFSHILQKQAFAVVCAAGAVVAATRLGLWRAARRAEAPTDDE